MGGNNWAPQYVLSALLPTAHRECFCLIRETGVCNVFVGPSPFRWRLSRMPVNSTQAGAAYLRHPAIAYNNGRLPVIGSFTYLIGYA
jgi:hypothetical protein